MQQEKEWASEQAGRIFEKVKAVAERNREKIPYSAVNGVFDDWSDRISWWTNGFWAGQLWQLYYAFGDEELRRIAEQVEEKLEQNLMDYMGMDHDSGFRWLLTAGANYRITGNRTSRNRLLLAAGNLAGRFNLAGSFLRAWNDEGTGETAGWAIIDCMMNLPLLYWASRETRDPRFAQIAVRHADMAVKVFQREDGSVNHIVTFDPESGKVLGSLGGQGYGEGSSWTRGQAWAIYGFTLSYIHTKKEEYLKAARKTADYFIRQMPEEGLIPVDFCQPEDCAWEDSTAAAIAACGLLELDRCLRKAPNVCHETKYETDGSSEVSNLGMSGIYQETALRLLHVLIDHRCDFDLKTDPILEKCTAAYHDENHEFPIIYGDYFLTEALLKLCGRECFLW